MRLFSSVLLFMQLGIVLGFMRSGLQRRALSVAQYAGPRPLHKVFTVEKATEELKQELSVASWGRWSTQGTDKYITGVKSPLKVYDCNELSYIISGKMTITPADPPGEPVLVQAGDFVTFPDGFACYWFVIDPVVKNWYIYN